MNTTSWGRLVGLVLIYLFDSLFYRKKIETKSTEKKAERSGNKTKTYTKKKGPKKNVDEQEGRTLIKWKAMQLRPRNTIRYSEAKMKLTECYFENARTEYRLLTKP